MKTTLIALILLTTSLACRKSNSVQPTVPAKTDSLLNWKEMGSLPGKLLNDIWFVSPSNGFVASDNIYQTTDSGKTWAPTTGTSVSGGFFNLFFVDSKNGFAQGLSQLAVTVDAGATWTVKPLPTQHGLTFFFVNTSMGFYGDIEGGGLRKTTDAGNNWISVFNDQNSQDWYYPYFLNTDTGYVATGSGTFALTTDGGQNWQAKSGLPPGNPNSPGYNQLLFSDIKNGFYTCPAGILKTADGGSTWNNVLPSSGSSVNVIKFPNSEIGYNKSDFAIYKSADGGESWTLNCKLTTDQLMGMCFLDIHTGWACTANGRIIRLQQ